MILSTKVWSMCPVYFHANYQVPDNPESRMSYKYWDMEIICIMLYYPLNSIFMNSKATIYLNSNTIYKDYLMFNKISDLLHVSILLLSQRLAGFKRNIRLLTKVYSIAVQIKAEAQLVCQQQQSTIGFWSTNDPIKMQRWLNSIDGSEPMQKQHNDQAYFFSDIF